MFNIALVLRFRTTFFLFLLLFPLPLVAHHPDCSIVYYKIAAFRASINRLLRNHLSVTQYLGDVPVRMIPIDIKGKAVEYVSAARALINVSDIIPDFNPSSEIIFGYEIDGHGYFLFGQYRFEGNAMGDGYSLNECRKASLGVLIRLRGVPSDRIGALFELLLVIRPRIEGVACVDKNVRAIEAVGIRMRGARLLPSRIFLGSIIDGFELDNGEPIHSDIYVTNGVELENIAGNYFTTRNCLYSDDRESNAEIC